MTLNDFDTYLWSAADEGRELASLSHAYIDSGSSEKLSVEVVLVHDDDAEQALLESAEQHVLATRSQGGALVMRCAERRDEYIVALWRTQIPNVRLLAAAVSPTDDKWERALRWVRNASPSVSRLYLNQKTLTDLVAGLSEIESVTISRLSARKFADGSTYNRGWAASRGVPQPSLDEVLSETRSTAAITKLQVSVGQALTVHLRRLAGATFHSGSFAVFDRKVLDPLTEAAGARIQLLRGRERRADQQGPPVVVRSPERVFDSLEFRESFVEKLADISQTGIAVLHGNPYLHVAVTDYSDGSNFDAFITDADQFKIYPGYRASPAAISHFTAEVASLIGASEIGNGRPPARPTLDDLLSDG